PGMGPGMGGPGMGPGMGGPGMGHGMGGPGMGPGVDPCIQAQRYAQWMEAACDIANGKPNVEKIMGLMQGYDGQFWKGVVVGAAAALLIGNETVKGAVTETFAGIWGIFQGGSKDAAEGGESASAGDQTPGA
ncbi:MAG: hypothetical protein ACLFQQ_16155, partial [Desulfococcaceae bacterium]